MCGIAGVMLHRQGSVGEYLIKMMETMQHRGTDSSGVAIYGPKLPENEHVVMVLVKDLPGVIGKIGNAIGKAGGDIRNIEFRHSPAGNVGINKYIIRAPGDGVMEKVVENINETDVGDVISYGHSIQVLKDLGDVSHLESGFNISAMKGTHGVGHVRFSTESKVDRLHAHPFHSSAFPDMAIVHNGQITNYHKIRHSLERRGHKFASDNDTEVILHYVVDQIQQKASLKEALERSIEDLDGPFSYIVSTPNAIGVARDKLGLRPALFSQDRSGYYVASEEVALIAIDKAIKPEYIDPGEARVYERKGD